MEIKTIFNLQTKGEHPICGPNLKLESSGFAYDPIEFERHGITVFNYQWNKTDETAGQIMKIVKQMKERLEKGKIMIHCHSGTGRTGVVIACFLIFSEKIDITSAISKVKLGRQNTFASEQSIKVVEKFDLYLSNLRNVFPEEPKTAAYFVENQNFLGCSEKNYINLIPRVVTEILEKILIIKNKLDLSFEDFLARFLLKKEWEFEMERAYTKIKTDLEFWRWESLEKEEDIMVLSQLLRDWLEDSCIFLVDPDNASVFTSNLSFNTLHNQEIMENKETVDSLLEDIRNILDVFEYRYLLFLADFLVKLVKIDDTNFAKVSSFIKYIGMLSMNIDRTKLESDVPRQKKSTIQTLNRFGNLILFLVSITKETTHLVDEEHFGKDAKIIDETYLVRRNTASNIFFDLQAKPLVIQDCDSSFLSKLTVYEENEEAKNKNQIFRVNSYLNRVFMTDNKEKKKEATSVSKSSEKSMSVNSLSNDSDSQQSEEKKGMFDIVDKLRSLRKQQNHPAPNKTEFEEIKKNPNAPRRFSDASKFMQFGNLDRN